MGGGAWALRPAQLAQMRPVGELVVGGATAVFATGFGLMYVLIALTPILRMRRYGLSLQETPARALAFAAASVALAACTFYGFGGKPQHFKSNSEPS